MCFVSAIELEQSEIRESSHIYIRFFKKEAEIVEALYREQRLESREDIGFAPIGLDEPYRIVVGNNPVNKIDPLGLDDLDPDDIPSPGHLEPNPNGLVCNLVCNLGGGLVSTSLGLSGVGATITVPVWIASRGFCAYICPPVIKQCEIKK